MADPATQTDKSPEQLFAERLLAHSVKRARTVETVLEALVEVSSPTGHNEGLERCLDVVGGGFSSMGFATAMLAGSESSKHLLARRAGGDDAPTVLLMGHVDTVFEVDHPFTGFTRADDQALGPGVGAKGGVVGILALLDALKPLGLLDAFDFRILVTTDGESQSHTSATLVDRVTRGVEIALVFEPASEQGALVNARAGGGQFQVQVTGRASCASTNALAGRNAILELAHKIPQIDAITNPRRGIVANCSMIHGGQLARLVPDQAGLVIDVTCRSAEDIPEIKARLEEIVGDAMMEGCVSTLTGDIGRPPWPSNPHTEELLGIWVEASRTLGITDLAANHGGSAGDANLVYTTGVPVLDGLGPVAGEMQTEREWIELSSLPHRTALNVMSLVTWLHQRAQGIWRPRNP